MFIYYVRLAWLSFKKTPVLSALIIGAIGLGVGVCISILTVYTLMIKDPVPGSSEKVFTYKLDSQPELEEHRTSDGAYALVGYRDATNIAKSDIPTAHSLHYQTEAVIFPAKQEQSAFKEEIRLANSGFFEVHQIPFQHGSAWTGKDEVSSPFQTVLTKALNEQLFNGANSVGKSLTIGANTYTVVGVMDEFKPIPRYFETDGGAFSIMVGAVIPFSLTRQLELRKRGGSSRCFEDPAEDTFKSFLEAECKWIHHWVSLENESAQRDFKSFLANYTLDQRRYGRYMGPFTHELHDVMSWLADRNVVNQDYRLLLSVAFLFLFVCLLNCVGLLLAKFLGKSPEMSLRRAVGGSRKMIFRQHMVEISFIGLLGGFVGLLVSLFGLFGIKSLYQNYEQLTHVGWELVLITLVLAVGATLLAGIFPAWRACRLPVSQFLKSQ
ncbi:MAG: putative ABC transport system permease protein [Gammaproteobacteria bacterium]|jgi:putative ABC transport system permease protein